MDNRGENAEPSGSKSINYTRIIDLSQVIHSNVPQWPGDPPVQFTTVASINEDGFFLRRFSLGEHSGTHMNVPRSFHEGGATIDGYSGESLVKPAVVVDVQRQAAANPDYTLKLEDVSRWEHQHGEIPANSLVLLRTGWQDKWGRPDAYLGRNIAGVCHFPGFGTEVVRFLVEKRAIAGVGIDTHGVDPGTDTSFSVNRLVLEQPRIVLENLTNMDSLPPTGVTLVIGVLRLLGGSGSPVSVLAFVP